MAPIRFREMILWHTCMGNIIQETANAGCGHGSAHPLLRGLQSSTAHHCKPLEYAEATLSVHSCVHVLWS